MKSDGVDMPCRSQPQGDPIKATLASLSRDRSPSHQVEDFGRVGVLWTRALDVSLAAKLIGQRPSHSIDDQAALDPEDDMPEE